MRVNTHPGTNMIPCYRGLVPFHIVKDDPMQLSAALGLQVRQCCFERPDSTFQDDCCETSLAE